MSRLIRIVVTVMVALAASAKSSYQDGRLLAYAETEVNHTRRAYYCVETHNPDRILIGHKAQRKPAKRRPVVDTVAQIQYDDRELWIRQPGRGTVRLSQDYLTRAFAPSSSCEAIVENAWTRMNAPPKTLHVRGVSTPQLQ